MNIDEILERAEKVEEKTDEGEQGSELLSAFKVRLVDSSSTMDLLFFIFQDGEG